jgi:hypothetical protein
MSGGRKAYITRLGARSQKSDLVDIFEHDDSENVGSVASQRDFHQQWLASLDPTK